MQSTTTAPGSVRAGANMSKHRWSITGTCRWLKAALSRIRRTAAHTYPVPAPPGTGGERLAPGKGRQPTGGREEAEPYVRRARG
ncbi:hypothetical protein GCM10010326_45850 [Streptomyces xanthochromogenes]|uniref:Transposase n=1 Tax=Streptomyces xanthochromogenes TaxID=67384 RepID=A0ABQ3ADJ4_9ACTN|nr:hypothetical protein GCM10010326_45850 [Streptomyces xanthochromogenes]